MNRRMFPIRRASAVAAVVYLAGCNSSETLNVEDALARLRPMVDNTVEEVARNLDVHRGTAFAASACEDGMGNPLETVNAPYGATASLADGTDIETLFADTVAYWRSQDYDVSDVVGTDADRSVEAMTDGYLLSLNVIVSNGGATAYFDGSTPCARPDTE